MTQCAIGVVGCAGRMGLALLRQIHETEGCRIAGGSERAGHPAIGQDLGALIAAPPLEIAVTGDPEGLFGQADAVLDFTAPPASVRHAALAADSGTPLIVGTTGFDAAQDDAIAQAAARVAIVKAGNMSVGVNLLVQLTRRVAAILDEDFDLEIVEMHHRWKVDAPSGTALMLGKAAAEGRGVAHEAAALFGRHGETGPRPKGGIGYAALRGGNVVGDHTVIFAADNERIELAHRAADRGIFARGAVRAALWAQGKPAGLYGMADVLGFQD